MALPRKPATPRGLSILPAPDPPPPALLPWPDCPAGTDPTTALRRHLAGYDAQAARYRAALTTPLGVGHLDRTLLIACEAQARALRALAAALAIAVEDPTP